MKNYWVAQMLKFLQWYEASGDGRQTYFWICTTTSTVWYYKTMSPGFGQASTLAKYRRELLRNTTGTNCRVCGSSCDLSLQLG